MVQMCIIIAISKTADEKDDTGTPDHVLSVVRSAWGRGAILVDSNEVLDPVMINEVIKTTVLYLIY